MRAINIDFDTVQRWIFSRWGTGCHISVSSCYSWGLNGKWNNPGWSQHGGLCCQYAWEVLLENIFESSTFHVCWKLESTKDSVATVGLVRNSQTVHVCPLFDIGLSVPAFEREWGQNLSMRSNLVLNPSLINYDNMQSYMECSRRSLIVYEQLVIRNNYHLS